MKIGKKFVSTDIVVLLVIVLFGFLLRVIGINWDHGYYLHPDERAIFLFSLPLSLPTTVEVFLSPESPLNPKFFAYGSFPLYTLKSMLYLASHVSSEYGGYGKGYFVGRSISILLDSGIIVLLFALGKKIFTTRVALLAAFFYSIATFPIQNSHFFTSDVFLSFFLLLSLFLFLTYLHTHKLMWLLASSAAFGLAMGSKISALPFLIVIFLGMYVECFIALLRRRDTKMRNHMRNFSRASYFFLIYVLFAYVVFVLVEPYAVIDFETFWLQLAEQQQMTKSAFTFPYTLQYVGKLPYIYEVRQFFLWGVGAPLGVVTIGGFLYVVYSILRNFSWKKSYPLLLCVLFVVLYFGIIGRFAVGWMRYMLPLYPFLLLFAAFFCVRFLSSIFTHSFFKGYVYRRYIVVIFFLFAVSAWTFSFLTIYFSPHPRVAASAWMHENIPAGSTLAIEHWDDSLPLYELDKYNTVSLPLYEVDSGQKWQSIEMLLADSDYIVLSSNRLVEPLTRLSKLCPNIPSQYCYTQTAAYYESLFSGGLGFSLVKTFESYPRIPIVGIPINDQMADESFTVYDHPNVYIFEKIHTDTKSTQILIE